jgi:hypothetical protein
MVQGGGDDGTNARDLLEPAAFFAWTMPGMDALLDGSDLCCDRGVLAGKNTEAELSDRGDPTILLVSNDLNSSAVPLRPFAEIMPSSARWPRIAFDSIVRWRTSSCRLRCNITPDCCCSLLIGTKRIDGRVTASQIAAASLAAFLLR